MKNYHSFIHSVSQSVIHSVSHSQSFIHSGSHSFIQSVIHSFIQSFIHSVSHSFVQSLIHSVSHSVIHSVIHSVSHSFSHSLIQSCIHSVIHSFLHTLCLIFFLLTYWYVYIASRWTLKHHLACHRPPFFPARCTSGHDPGPIQPILGPKQALSCRWLFFLTNKGEKHRLKSIWYIYIHTYNYKCGWNVYDRIMLFWKVYMFIRKTYCSTI